MTPFATRSALRRLRVTLLLFFLGLSIPLSFLITRVYKQMEREMFYQYRAYAEEAALRMNQRVQELLAPEEQRPFEEYSFLNVAQNELLRDAAIKTSPLSEIPPRSAVPGVIGYFQLNPDGTLHSPVLPELTEQELRSNISSLGLGAEELQRRLSLRNQLQSLLSDEKAKPIVVAAGRGGDGSVSDTFTGVSEYPVKVSDTDPSAKTTVVDEERDKSELAQKIAGEQKTPSAAPIGAERNYREGSEAQRLLGESLDGGYADSEEEPFAKQAMNAIASAKDIATGALSKSNAYRERRKEQVALPEQSTVKQLQDLLAPQNAAPVAAPAAVASETVAGSASAGSAVMSDQLSLKGKFDRKDMIASADLNAPVAPPQPQAPKPVFAQRKAPATILTFESEVDPFQFTSLSSGKFVFYRKAWRNKLRYIQGFVVDRETFLRETIETPLNGAAIGETANVAVRLRGELLLTHSPASRERSLFKREVEPQKAILPLYGTGLEAPLENIDVTFSMGQLPRSVGAQVVDILAVVLGVVMILGSLGIYRLGRQQIELAQQRSDFVSAVSHELKTPLTSIRMYGEMLRSGYVKEESKLKSYYDFIFFESERLSRLIANVLQLSRLTNHQSPLELQPFTASQLLDLVRSKITSQTEAAGFQLELKNQPPDLDTTQIKLRAEEDAFTQIFINLVDNAVKFSAHAETKKIEYGIRRGDADGSRTIFYVRDFGPGVPADQMKRIFQLFYRAEDELTRSTKGTGIGLALVKELAAKMNAKVDLRNCAPGAEFQLIFD